MIYEYALDPKLIIKWATDKKDCRYFNEKFGIGKSRLICEYPREAFHKQFEDELKNIENDMQKTRALELYRSIASKTIKRELSKYENNLSWLENADKEHNRCKFHAILACSNPQNNENIIDGLNFDEKHSRWKLESGKVIIKKAKDIADTLAEMLKNAESVIFIDPYFEATIDRFQKTYELFFEKFTLQCRNSYPPRIEIHASTKRNPYSSTSFKKNCEQMKAYIPKNLTVTFKVWRRMSKGPDLHNRYILTDLGGILLGHGTDEGKKGYIDDINLLASEQYSTHWRNYISQPVFILDGPAFKIIGNR